MVIAGPCPEETLRVCHELDNPGITDPSQHFSWPSVVATKNELIQEKPHLLALLQAW
jgi:hypothetical protein